MIWAFSAAVLLPLPPPVSESDELTNGVVRYPAVSPRVWRDLSNHVTAKAGEDAIFAVFCCDFKG